MGLRIATSTIRPTYQLHGMAARSACVVSTETEGGFRLFCKTQLEMVRTLATCTQISLLQLIRQSYGRNVAI
jgi:hypothetical protein